LKRLFTTLLLTATLQACAPISDPNGGITADTLSNAEYMALSPIQKYAVSNKLLTTLYKGIPVDDFFDLQEGLTHPVLRTNKNQLEQVKAQLSTPMNHFGDYINLIYDKYLYNESRQRNTRAAPMAILQEFPLSKEYYHRWIAYILMNTILFSPAYELDSVDHTDVETVYNTQLVEALDNSEDIRQIVYNHVVSEENWRRFRSPEDNTREMMEIYLKRFRDDEVPLAAIACKNWYLTDDREGYQLRKGANVNTVPQTLLDRNDIVTCEDFYHALANHQQLIPAITSRLVDVFFAGKSAAERAAIADHIAATHPSKFEQIFEAILFSREYLLNTSRTKSYEETLYGTGSRIHWYAWYYMFHDLNDNNPGSSRPDLSEIRQANMKYKLGRANDVPTDSLALAYYHKSIRDRLMLDRRYSSDPNNTSDGGWSTSFISPEDGNVDTLSNEDFIHYIMLSTVGRKANPNEVTTLTQIINDNGYQNNRSNQAWIIMDYASRLTELYTLPAISGDVQ
jgi:hypothetical protein